MWVADFQVPARNQANQLWDQVAVRNLGSWQLRTCHACHAAYFGAKHVVSLLCVGDIAYVAPPARTVERRRRK